MVTASQSFPQSAVTARRQETLSMLLERRIAAAKARNDHPLMALLEREQQQLAQEWAATQPPAGMPALRGLQRGWTWLRLTLDRQSQLSVEQMIDADGVVWWRGFDPRTGKGLFAESEAEVVCWIEQNHL